MYDSEADIVRFEFSPESSEENSIKTEPEEPTESETNNKDCLNLDVKDHVKTEVIELYDEKYNIIDYNFQVNLCNEEYNLENVKLESSLNDIKVMNITNAERALTTRETLHCPLCSFTIKVPNQMKRHLSQVHSIGRKLHCLYCGYTAKTNDTLRIHTLSKHCDNYGRVRTMHVCYICEKEFVKKNNLKKHLKNVHFKIMAKCTECDYEAINDCLLGKHILLEHHSENLFRCHNCRYASPYKSNLKYHILTEHLNYYTYTCDICEDFKTKSSWKLEMHKYAHKNSPEYFECKYCPFTSKSKLRINIHIRDQHVKKYRFTCSDCKYETNFLNRLNYHVIVKHNKNDFVCPECGKFRSKYEENLNIHMLQVHKIKTKQVEKSVLSLPVLKCKFCSFKARIPSRMKKHFNQIHSERSYHCLYCNYTAVTNKQLKSHILNKHEDKCGKLRTRHICHICKKVFIRKLTLNIHINNMHLNIMEKCPECDYEAMNYNQLNSHVLLVHHPENLFTCFNCGYAIPDKEKLKHHILTEHP